MSERSSESFLYHQGRGLLAWLLVACTFVLILAGGLVTSHGVGLAVPDWPKTYGDNMFFFPIAYWQGGIFYEHTHRLLASLVGLLTMILAIWFFGRKARPWLRVFALACLVFGVAGYFLLPAVKQDDKVMFLIIAGAAFAASFFWPACDAASKRMRWLGVIAFFAVVLQGVLGGVRVTALKDELGIFHAALAQLFLILVVCIALFNSRWWRRLESGSLAHDRGLRSVYWVVALMVFGQLLLGATMRHQHAGLAIPDFPLAYGKVWPPTDAASVLEYNQRRMEARAYNEITAFQIHLQMVHRIAAVAILLAAGLCARLTVRRLGWQNPLARLALALMALVVAQFFLGAATVWTGKAADVATAHVAGGAATLVVAALLCLISRRLMVPLAAPARESAFIPGAAAVSPLK